MGNANYEKGVRLEREIVNLFKDVGCASARTAGSHGTYDLYAIGTHGQLLMGIDKLQLAGFRPTKDSYVRVGQTYRDTLYIMEVADEANIAVFIQAKRKEK